MAPGHRLERIEGMISDELSLLPDQEALQDRLVRQVARLAVLRRMIGNGSRNRAAAREAKEAFRKELDEYVSDARVRAVSKTWSGNDIEVIVHHYGRILALSCAIEFSRAEAASRRIARLVRDETSGLCDAYHDWIARALDRVGPSLDRREKPANRHSGV